MSTTEAERARRHTLAADPNWRAGQQERILSQHPDAVDYIHGHPVPGQVTLLDETGQTLGYYPDREWE